MWILSLRYSATQLATFQAGVGKILANEHEDVQPSTARFSGVLHPLGVPSRPQAVDFNLAFLNEGDWVLLQEDFVLAFVLPSFCTLFSTSKRQVDALVHLGFVPGVSLVRLQRLLVFWRLGFPARHGPEGGPFCLLIVCVLWLLRCNQPDG